MELDLDLIDVLVVADHAPGDGGSQERCCCCMNVGAPEG